MTIEITIAIIGIVIALATYIQGQKPTEIKLSEPKEEIENLKVHFLVNQKLSLEIQEILENYIVENNASEKLLFENMSFSKYLNFVREEHENGLSEIAGKMISQQLTRPIIEI
jgi:hypothetical protein